MKVLSRLNKIEALTDKQFDELLDNLQEVKNEVDSLDDEINGGFRLDKNIILKQAVKIGVSVNRLKKLVDKYVEASSSEPLDENFGKPCEVGIHFDLEKVNFDDLYKIEELLHKNGIDFDTGAGMGERDWEWDWSLEGPVRVTFRRLKPEEKRNKEETVSAFKVLSKLVKKGK